MARKPPVIGVTTTVVVSQELHARINKHRLATGESMRSLFERGVELILATEEQSRRRPAHLTPQVGRAHGRVQFPTLGTRP